MVSKPPPAQAQPSNSTSPPGTGSIPYAPSAHQEVSFSGQPVNSIISFQHISVSPPYQKYSADELRLADYQANRRYTGSLSGTKVSNPSTLGSSTIGAVNGTAAVSTPKETTGSLFGTSSTGGGSLFGAKAPASLFGNNSGVNPGAIGSVKISDTPSITFGSNSTGGGSLFGAKAPISLFGNNSGVNSNATRSVQISDTPSITFGSNSTGGGSLFGTKAPVSLFGNNGVVNSGATSIFKANNTTGGIFGGNTAQIKLSSQPFTPTPSANTSTPTTNQSFFGTLSLPVVTTSTQQSASHTFSSPGTASTKQQPTSHPVSAMLSSTMTPNRDRRSTSATGSESKSASTDQESSSKEGSDATSDYESAKPVRKYAKAIAKTAGGRKPFTQYGLLGGDIGSLESEEPANRDPRVFWNIAAPSSFFICGSQGSGKSHTLSCLLENAMTPCEANVLPHPLTGIVFHYDTFISDTGGSPCEVAWLSSNPKIQVRVLCPPTNIRTMRKLYSRFPNIMIEELRLNQSDLDTRRMLDLMAVSSGTSMPLYLHVLNRVLRDLRIEQQERDGAFDYTAFKHNMFRQELTDQQLAPLKQRLDTLESFMVEQHAKAYEHGREPKSNKSTRASRGNDWTPRPGMLTIVDLSCPCVTAEMACSLFNICLSLFLEQDCNSIGRVIALDEAHKYMSSDTGSAECRTLTDRLLETIRLQRHLGARVIISTQEPTISPKLLDLCSVTIVHRFTSPDWLRALSKHLAGVSKGGRMLEKALAINQNMADDVCIENAGVNSLALDYSDPAMELFSRIVALRVGEALIFAPSAIIGVQKAIPRPPSTSTPAPKPVAGSGPISHAQNQPINAVERPTTDTTDDDGLQVQPGSVKSGQQSASDKQHQKTVTSVIATSSGTEKLASPTPAASPATVKRLAHGVLKVRIRNRTTADGGRSIMAA
ncbi:uncharacterized protein B0T23DRAFT_321974 [Neurospora hispaniola]|uniref:P-loop containing nucleoside triphosphate hydrolase protein n=1 Tax=Neurospora hispaniola TaxID=588809 RepID=A0AAJ0I3V7_9PEZI|nr:hypothetical protein B0T23DRAFT_321974 [Neurospora hispaniola]